MLTTRIRLRMASKRNPTSLLLTEDDLRAGLKSLRRRCIIIRGAHDIVGDPPLRDFTADFEGLAKIVVGQQLSAASANAIWGRVKQSVQPFAVTTIANMTDESLLKLGLSRGKLRTLRALSAAVQTGAIDFKRLNTLGDDSVRETLCQVTGIGPWTSDIFLLFAMRRADTFPSGDLALQIGVQTLFNLDAKPAAAELAGLAERWRPWRGIAAHLIWAHYAYVKSKRKSAAA